MRSGRMAKTGRLDALPLRAAVCPAQAPRPEPEGGELQALLRRRRQLVNQRVQERNWLERAWNQAVRASTQRHIEWLDQEIAALNQGYRDALESADLYRSVPGIGELTAAVPVANLQKLGRSEGKGLCSLVQGRRTAGATGRGSVRRALFMAALPVIRRPGELRQFYQGCVKGAGPARWPW